MSCDVNLMRIHGNIDTVMLCSFYLNQIRFFEKLILIGTQTAPFMFVTCYQNIGVGYNPQNQIILPRITNAHINHFFIVNLNMNGRQRMASMCFTVKLYCDPNSV